MSALFVNSLRLSRASLFQYSLFLSRLAHGLAIGLPGFLLFYFAGDDATAAAYIAFSFSLVSLFILHAFGVYSESIFTNRYRFKKTVLSWSTAYLVIFFMMHGLGRGGDIGGVHYLLWYLLTLVLLVLIRLLSLFLYRKLMQHGFYLSRSVIWGATDSGRHMAKYLADNQDIRSGLQGFIDERVGRLPDEIAGLPMLGDTKALIKLIQNGEVDQVLVALPWSAVKRTEEVLNILRSYSIAVLLVPEMVGMRHASNRISEVGGVPMFNISDFPLKGWSPVLKRLEDVVISSLMLLLLSPLLLLIALLIKLDSPGPVLFKQKRYGYNNILINVYKFRTMYHAARDMDASQQTVKNDSRVTSVGRFLRRSSLDELPQLFNVLKGHMSLVGPRPHATATKAAGVLFEDAVQNYAARHRVKPGITGWAQVNGFRGETDTLEKLEKRVEYDLEYIENWSILFDLYILLKTIPSIVFAKEAY